MSRLPTSPAFRLTAALLLSLFCQVPSNAAQVLRIPVYHNAPLVDYRDAGTPNGIFIDLLQSAARANGWTLEFVPGTFESSLKDVKEGRLDIMPDVASTPARQQDYLFGHVPVLHTWGQIYARGDSIRTILDLAGKRVVGVAGTVQLAYFEKTAASFGVEPEIIRARDYESGAQLVVNGQADALLDNPFGGAILARRAGLVDTAVMFDPFTEYFAGRRDIDPAIMHALDKHISALMADPKSIYFSSMRKVTEGQRLTTLPRWFAWAAAALSLVFIFGFAWVLTLRRAAARIAASEARQRNLAAELQRVGDNSLDVIAVVDPNLNLLRVNRATQALWGYAPEELVGLSCLNWSPMADREVTRGALERAREGRPQRSLATRVVRRDGRISRMLWSVVWSPHTREMYLIGRDDTERHELIAGLQTANADLRTFAQSVSHDLRSPLAAVVGFVGKVLAQEANALSDRSRDLLGRAHAASQRMDSIIANLLRLARLAELGLSRRSCDVTVLCEDVIVALRNADPARQVCVSVQPGMTAWADRDLLRHVVENLLSNAWKFSQYSAAPSIEIGMELRDAEPVYIVRDNGAGFDMAFVEGLFKPFTRLHDPATYNGTGIGLTIAQRVVAGHGGRIWAESTPALGATFRFTLGQLEFTEVRNGPDQSRGMHTSPAPGK
jgi:PAS domain S-box-containing protein